MQLASRNVATATGMYRIYFIVKRSGIYLVIYLFRSSHENVFRPANKWANACRAYTVYTLYNGYNIYINIILYNMSIPEWLLRGDWPGITSGRIIREIIILIT